MGIVLVSMATNVHGHCDRNKIEEPTEHKDRGKVSKFLHSVGCGLYDGVKVLSEGVKSGYGFLKGKISSIGRSNHITDEPTTTIGTDPLIDVRLGE